ncbi:MAG TPA: WYL domain-containing protein [Candidatus Omnitrophota bacterium]|nr:WYL domain-containing protein [Candidatus Omnitrophota bacterium]
MAKNKSYDKKIFRLMSILNKLNGGGKVRSSEIAKEFNVSIRSVQRDIELLNQTQFPVVSLEKGIYSFMEGFSLKKMMLTNEEASLLTFFHEIADSLGKNFSESFRSLVSKVLAKEEDSPFYVKLPETHAHMKNFPFVKELEKAVSDSQKVMIKYETEKGLEEFKLCPLKLINFDGFWYLLAMPDGMRAFWKFRSEKIKGLEMLDENFDPPRSVKSVLDRSVNIWFNEKPGEKIVLEIDKDAAHYFKKKIYFPDQKIVKEKKDGSLVLETYANFNEVIRTIIHWIPDIRVIKPKDLDSRIRDLLNAYLKGAKPRWG